MATKSEAACRVEMPLRIASTARKSGAAMTTPTSWPRMRVAARLGGAEEVVERRAPAGRRRSPAGCWRSSARSRWASTLRSSSESPSPLPTPWLATTIAAITKTIAASAARRRRHAPSAAPRRAPASLLDLIRSAPLVEVELGQGALDHLGGHLLRDLEVAGAHGDVVEGDDAGQAVRRRRPAAAAPGAGPSAPPPRRAPSPARRRSAAARRARRPAPRRRPPRRRPAAARSRSVTIATGEPPGSTITTEPTRWSRISRATETALASGAAVTTPAVMISLSFTARTLHGDERQSSGRPVVPLEAGAGPENPPCPACGEPLFGWIDLRAGPRRPGQPLRELRPRRRRRAGRAPRTPCAGWTARPRTGRSGSPTAAASPPGSAAPAGPGLRAGRPLPLHGRGGAPAGRPPRPGRAPRPAGRRAPASRRCGRRSSTASPSAATSRSAALGRAEAVPAEKPWQRRMDAVISVVVAVPALLFAAADGADRRRLPARRRRSGCGSSCSSGRARV